MYPCRYVTQSCIHKLSAPVLTAADVPYEATFVFNAGVIRHNGRYVMAFRDDHYDEARGKVYTERIGFAFSEDGIAWKVEPDLGYVCRDDEVQRAYDPRLTVIDGQMYMCFALDTKHGVRGGIAKVSDDFTDFEVLSLSVPDNRNMVLFPERINGNYVRLERPMPVYSRGRDAFDLWLSRSPDLRLWGDSQLVMGLEQVPFADNKIGPGAPPVKTDKGWLTTFHAVELYPERGKNGWEERWQKEYTVGIALLDLEDPAKVIGFCREPLMVPDMRFELEGGFRNNVLFPCGMVLEDSGEVKLYYGASDTTICLATADVDDLLRLCLE